MRGTLQSKCNELMQYNIHEVAGQGQITQYLIGLKQRQRDLYTKNKSIPSQRDSKTWTLQNLQARVWLGNSAMLQRKIPTFRAGSLAISTFRRSPTIEKLEKGRLGCWLEQGH